MSDDKIAEIRARHLREDRWCYSPSPQMHDDRAFLLAEVERLRSQVEIVNLLKAEITLLRKALEPLAQLYLWPDDIGEDMANLIRSDDDWSEEANEDADSDVFIKRKYIRAARHALEGKP